MVNFDCIWAAVAVFLLCAGQSNGAEAAFSKDGKKVFLVTEGKLLVLQLDSGRVADLHFPDMVKDSELQAIAGDGQRGLACLTKLGLWKVDPDAGSATPVQQVLSVPASQQNVDSRDAETGGSDQAERAYSDIAILPRAHRTLIISTTQNYWLLSGKNELSPVRIRRHDMVAPVFAGNGDIFYAGDGDLWHGRIVHDEMSDADGTTFVTDSVEAYRYAPLAIFETANATTSETAVTNVAVSAKMLYAQVKRWGGTGWGHIVRLAKPPPIRTTVETVSPYPLQRVWPMYIKALQSVKILGDSSRSPSYLCSSEDGRRMFFVTRDTVEKDSYTKVRAWLTIDDGSPREIPIHSEVEL